MRHWTRILGLLGMLGRMLGMNLSPTEAAEPARVRYVGQESDQGISAAVIVHDAHLVHTGQFLPVDAEGKLVGADQVQEQVSRVVANLEIALELAASDLASIVKLNVYVSDDEAANAVRAKLSEHVLGDARPAVCFVAGNLALAGARVAMDAVAVAKAGALRQSTTDDQTGEVRRAVSSRLFSRQAQLAQVAILPPGPKVYIAGQAEPGDVRQATRATLESLKKTLEFLSLGLEDVVQVKSFLTPIESAHEVEEVIAEFFAPNRAPVVAFVEWSSNLPIEIELVASAARSQARMPALPDPIEFLTPPGMTASPVYSRVARTTSDAVIYVSGLYGGDSTSGEGQVREIFAGLQDVLRESGSDLKHLVKATYYVANEDASQKLNAIRPEFYDPKRPPAASKALVRGVGQARKTITLDMIAVPAP